MMPELIVIPDDEYDRRKYIGGSNAAAIMGVGATYDGIQQTPYTVYQTKVGEVEEDMSPGRQLFLKRRKRWEGPIVEMLKEEFDGNIMHVNRRYRDPQHEFLAAEIDFEWVDGDGHIQNGEIKTVSPFAHGEQHGWGEPGTSDIPVHYAAQTMHGLGVTRPPGVDDESPARRICIVAAMIGLDNMLFYPIERDDEVISEMRDRMVNFWIDHVLALRPPEPLNLDDVMALSLRMRGRPVELDDATMEALRTVKNIRDSAKAFADDETKAKFDILNFIRKAWEIPSDGEVKDNAALLYHGIKVASYNASTTTRIDVDRLRQEEPEIASHFSKSSESRRLLFTKPKS